jgi:hypothetical protein
MSGMRDTSGYMSIFSLRTAQYQHFYRAFLPISTVVLSIDSMSRVPSSSVIYLLSITEA